MAKRDDENRMGPAYGSEEHDKKLQHALGRVKVAEDLHNTLVPIWIDNYKAFRAMPTSATPTGKQSWQSDVRSPYVAEQVLTMQPRLVEGRPTVDVLRQDPNTPMSVARMQRQWLAHTLWQDSFPMKSARLALHTVLFGVGWTKQSYLYEQKTRTVVNRETGVPQDIRLTTANRPTMSIPHPMDTMWDPSAQVLETARFVILRTVTTVGQVKAKARRKVRQNDGSDKWVGMYENTDEVKAYGRNADQQFPDKIDLPSHVSSRAGGGRVEILEILDKEIDQVITIANRMVVLRAHRMPWWHGDMPVACAVTTPNVSTLHGIAEVDWIKPLQEMLWLLENQRLDNTRLQMDMVLLVRDTLMDLDDYQLGPGEKWPVTNMDDIQPLQYPQPQLASIGDIESIRGRLQAIIGTAFMTGGDSGAMGVNQETASGLMSIIEEGNRRVDFRMNLMRLAYERALGHMLSDGAQFLDEAGFVPAAKKGGDPIPVSPEELAAKAWVRVTLGSESGNRSFKQQVANGLMTAAQAFKGTPIPTEEGLAVFNDYPVLEVLADAYDKEPEEFLTSVQKMQQMTAAADPAAQAAAQQQAAAPTSVQMPGAPA